MLALAVAGGVVFGSRAFAENFVTVTTVELGYRDKNSGETFWLRLGGDRIAGRPVLAPGQVLTESGEIIGSSRSGMAPTPPRERDSIYEDFRSGTWLALYRLSHSNGYSRTAPWRTDPSPQTILSTPAEWDHGKDRMVHRHKDLILSKVNIHDDGVRGLIERGGQLKDNGVLLGMDVKSASEGNPLGIVALPARVGKFLDSFENLWDGVLEDQHVRTYDRFVVSYPHPQYSLVRFRVWVSNDDWDDTVGKAIQQPDDVEDPRWGGALSVRELDRVGSLPDGTNATLRHPLSREPIPLGRVAIFELDLDKLWARHGTDMYGEWPFQVEYGEKDSTWTFHTKHSHHTITLAIVRQEQRPVGLTSEVSFLARGSDEVVASQVLAERMVHDNYLAGHRIILLRGPDGRFYDPLAPEKPYDRVKLHLELDSSRVHDSAGRRLVMRGQAVENKPDVPDLLELLGLGGSQPPPPWASVHVQHPPAAGANDRLDGNWYVENLQEVLADPARAAEAAAAIARGGPILHAGKPYWREGVGTVDVVLSVANLPRAGSVALAGAYEGGTAKDPFHDLSFLHTVGFFVVDAEIGPSGRPRPPESRPRVRVPDVVGRTSADAKISLSNSGLRGLDSVDPDAPPDGRGVRYVVVKQDPTGGTEVDRGSSVTLTLGARVVVPDVVGRVVGDARAVLDGARLKAVVPPGDPDEAPTPNSVRRIVVRQVPRAGSEVDTGSEVSLTLEVRVAVPNVVGKWARSARDELAALGLSGDVTHSGRVPVSPHRASIASQATAPGTVVAVGTRVALVAKVTEVEVPNLVGRTSAEANDVIVGALLLNEGAPGTPDSMRRRVVAQNPPAGRWVRVETVVGYTLETPKIRIPDVVGQMVRDAEATLEKAGFGHALPPADPDAPPAPKGATWLVVRQNPAAGTEGKAGDVVGLFLEPRIVVPNLVGMWVRTARDELAARGMTGDVDMTGAPPRGGYRARVTSQSPIAGSVVGTSARVAIQAEIAEVEVPSLAGLGGRGAREALQAALLNPPYVDPRAPAVASHLKVASQNPAAGTYVAVGATVEFAFEEPPTATVAVPALLDRKQDDAVKRLEKAGLRADVRRLISHGGGSVWIVTSQYPDAGTQVAPGSTVQVGVELRGPARVKVPSILGMRHVEAQHVLAAVGLKERFTDVDGKGLTDATRCIEQNPKAGDWADVGSGVVGRFRTPSQEKARVLVVVPRLIGLTVEEARGALKLKHLGSQGSGDSGAGARVDSQDPAQGALVSEWSVVKWHAKGQPATTVTVPNVIGLMPNAAAKKLQDAGLVAKLTVAGMGKVYSQNPAAGSKRARGSTVEIKAAPE